MCIPVKRYDARAINQRRVGIEVITRKTRYKAVISSPTVYPKKYAHGFCFVVLCCGYTLTDFLISIRLTSLALWQSNDCPSASKATLMNVDKYFMWIHYERLHNHNKAKHNKTVCIFLGIYCIPHGICLQLFVFYHVMANSIFFRNGFMSCYNL